MSVAQWCPYLLLLCFVAYLAGWKQGLGRRACIVFIELAGVVESVTAIRQVLGLSVSRHAIFALTGSFDNPGPLGGFLAISAAIAVSDVVGNYPKLANPFRAERKDVLQVIYAWISAIAAVLCLVVLPATMSRAGWIAAAAAIAFYFLGTDSAKSFMARHRYVLPLCFVLLLTLAAGSFLLKPESALGRLHIWHMETLAVLRKPFTGWGFGKVMGAYGIVQHDYFASAARTPWEIKVAGCPEYPFNEYLGAAMGGGLPALAIVLLILLLGINRLKGSPLKYGLIAFALFSFASYPMSIPLFRVALAILLGSALAPSRPFPAVHWLWGVVTLVLMGGTIFSAKERQSFREARKAVRMLSFSKSGYYYNGTADRLKDCYDILDDDFRYLYEYGMALHKEGRYRESNEVFLRGAGISSDPMFHNIVGRNFEALGDYGNAEKEYRYSAFQVPSRLYPHILLMKLYLRAGDDASARDEAERILTMRVNPRNRNMTSLREQALAARDSLMAVHRLELP